MILAHAALLVNLDEYRLKGIAAPERILQLLHPDLAADFPPPKSLAAFQGQFVRAATLLGAARALRESKQSVRLPPEQIEFDQALAHLAREMGESQRNAAMATGAEMSVDEAVALALKDPDSPLGA